MTTDSLQPTDRTPHRETSDPHEAITSAVYEAQDHRRAQTERIDKLSATDTSRQDYDSAVGESVASKLLGNNGKNKDGYQVQQQDGRYYGGSTSSSLPEYDASGKPTGNTIQLDKLSNGELAKLLKQTISDYDKPGQSDDGSSYKTKLEQSNVPKEEQAVGEAVSKAAELARVGQPGGLPKKDIDRLLHVKGDFSDADKRLLMYSGGGEAAVVAFKQARDAFQQYDTDKRTFNEKMAREGTFFEGKSRLCCCRNGRDKAVAMITRARTGNPPQGAACMSGHLEQVM
jgi:hypothetical protein